MDLYRCIYETCGKVVAAEQGMVEKSSPAYDEIMDYLLFCRYPADLDKNKKRMLRRKYNNFEIKNSSLYYSSNWED